MENILHWLNESQDYEMGVMLLQAYEPRNRMLPVIMKGESEYSRGKLKIELRRIYHSGQNQHLTDPDAYLNQKIFEATPGLSKLDKAKAMDMVRGREEKQADVIAAAVETVKPKKQPPPVPAKAARKAVRNSGRLYPEEIEKAIQVRAKLANERDRLANSLADLDTNEQRAAARAELEAVNKEVQKYHQFVKSWEQDKTVPEQKPWEEDAPAAQAHDMPDTEREALRKKLLSARVNRTKKKKAAKKWAADKDADPWMRKAKVELYQGEFMKWDGIVRELEEALK